MVGPLRREMERDLVPASSGNSPDPQSGIKCVRPLGLWRMVRRRIVPMAVVSNNQIAVKEMIPVVLGCAIWGHAWAGCRIIWRCDNQAVVACLGSRTSTDPTLMHLIRNIVFLEAYGGFHLQAEYIDTHANHVADDLPRNCMSAFFLKVPNASRLPSLPPSSNSRAPPGRGRGLGITPLVTSVQDYFGLGLADSTRKSYKAAAKHFDDFCTKFEIDSPFPVSEQLLCSFAEFLADDGLKLGTIKAYLAATRNLQLSLGLPDLRNHSSLPILKHVLTGIGRSQLKKG